LRGEKYPLATRNVLCTEQITRVASLALAYSVCALAPPPLPTDMVWWDRDKMHRCQSQRPRRHLPDRCKEGFAALSLLASAAIGVLAADELEIDVTLAVDCLRKTAQGDKIHVHYRGTLQSNGQQFDASTRTPYLLLGGRGTRDMTADVPSPSASN